MPLDPGELLALGVYADAPLTDGDVVLLVDGRECLELAGLADHWDAAAGAGFLAQLRTCRRVVVAVARTGADLHDSDRQLAADVAAALTAAGVEVPPLQALPAAA